MIGFYPCLTAAPRACALWFMACARAPALSAAAGPLNGARAAESNFPRFVSTESRNNEIRNIKGHGLLVIGLQTLIYVFSLLPYR